jgi:dihydropyrimidinase
VVVEDGKLLAKVGQGRFLAREAGDAAKPTGRMAPEFDPARNFGAKLM